MAHRNFHSREFKFIPELCADLADQGYEVPNESTVRRWALSGRVRAQRLGVNRLIVSVDDVRRMLTPLPL